MSSRSRVVSVAFALCGFTAAVASGVVAGNEPQAVLLRGLAALVACQIIGAIIGAMLTALIDEQSARYRAANPVPDVPEIDSARGGSAAVVDESVDQSGATRARA
jgi:hypothetical protein